MGKRSAWLVKPQLNDCTSRTEEGEKKQTLSDRRRVDALALSGEFCLHLERVEFWPFWDVQALFFGCLFDAFHDLWVFYGLVQRREEVQVLQRRTGVFGRLKQGRFCILFQPSCLKCVFLSWVFSLFGLLFVPVFFSHHSKIFMHDISLRLIWNRSIPQWRMRCRLCDITSRHWTWRTSPEL